MLDNFASYMDRNSLRTISYIQNCTDSIAEILIIYHQRYESQSHYPEVHGANMGPTWGRKDAGGLHVGHVDLSIWVMASRKFVKAKQKVYSVEHNCNDLPLLNQSMF